MRIFAFTLYETILALLLITILLTSSFGLLSINYKSNYEKLQNAWNNYLKSGIVDSSIGFKK